MTKGTTKVAHAAALRKPAVSASNGISREHSCGRMRFAGKNIFFRHKAKRLARSKPFF
jgi:hypothetical protein